jgi:hypothetical protein
MCRLLFAIKKLHDFGNPVALMGLHTRRGLISRKVDDDHLGRQTLVAYLLRSMLSSLSRTPL